MPTPFSSERFSKPSIAAKLASIALALVAFILAFELSWQVSMAGFPDGYLTEYDKVAKLPLTVVTWLYVAIGAYCSCLAFSGLFVKTRTIQMIVILSALALLIIIETFAIPWYFIDHLNIDNGKGG